MKKVRTGRRVLPWLLLIWMGLALPAAGLAGGLRLLVPAYGNPCCGGGAAMWTQLTDTALVMGSDLHVILNPASGPGVGLIDPNYVNDLGEGPLIDLRAAGGFVIGYVGTNYTMRSLADVKSEVDLYFDPSYWRGAGVQVQGIFFDEMSNDLAHVGYYQDLRDHVRSHLAGARVVGNPGTSFVNNPSGQMTWTVSDYAESADTLVTFESDANAYLTSYTPPSWLGSYPADRFGHIVFAEPSESQMVQSMRLAISRKAGYIYITDDVLVNPYDVLPAYWLREVEEAMTLVFADGFDSGDLSAWAP